MNIIICGLQGTGKTTLSKQIVKELGYKYINDYNICSSNFNKRQIMDFAKNNDNYVIDLCYSLNPVDYANLKDIIVYYLGFVSIDENLLFQLMKSKGEDITLEQIKNNKAKCKEMQRQCKKYNIPFYDINKDRKIILDNIMCDIKNKLSN